MLYITVLFVTLFCIALPCVYAIGYQAGISKKESYKRIDYSKLLN